MIKTIAQKMINAAWRMTHSSPASPPVVSIHDILQHAYGGQAAFDNHQWSIFDGGKFDGGFGATQLQHVDYWTLRARSSQLFNENIYAKGIIRRLVTNEINTGLTPECVPDEMTLGFKEDGLSEWTDLVEGRFHLWCKSKSVCDWKKSNTFGALQKAARIEALVSGDCLVVLRFNRQTGTPAVQLIRGASIQTPWGSGDKPREGNRIEHGVELDQAGRQVAYWVVQSDRSFKRLPAVGEKSGRRLAWLIYGTERRLDEVRGQPLLAIMLQSLKDLDRYRDSAQRQAALSSIIAMFVTKSTDKLGSLPLTGTALRRDQVSVSDDTTNGSPRQFNINHVLPGVYLDELQQGEDIKFPGGQGIDINLGAFEETIVQALAWCNEIPPEILRLAFSNNYSASQAAINEFKIYLNKFWAEFGDDFCSPVFEMWLVSEVARGKIDAPGLIESLGDPAMYDVLAAWQSAEWLGSIKPSTDTLKMGKGSELFVRNGWSTNAREARINTGTKFDRNVSRIKRENEKLAKARRPLMQEKVVKPEKSVV